MQKNLLKMKEIVVIREAGAVNKPESKPRSEGLRLTRA